MGKKTRVLKRSDRKVLRAAEGAQAAHLDVDDLLSLHKKVRKARRRHVAAYQERAGKKAGSSSARSVAAARAITARHRASLFEAALATVSTELARAAQHQAESLRTELLDEVRRKKAWKVQDGRGGARREDRKSHGRTKDARLPSGSRW